MAAAASWMRAALVLAVAVSALQASTESWEQLRVRYQPTAIGAGISGFWSVPQSYLAALTSGWSPAPNALPDGLGVLAAAAASGDLAFTPLYRSNLAGRLVGFNVAVPVADVYRTGPHDTTPAPPGGSNEIVWLQDSYYIQSSVLFVSPIELRSGIIAESDVSESNARLTDAGGLWVRNTSDPAGYTRLPTDLTQLAAAGYTRQGCGSGLGTHYYYNMSVGAAEGGGAAECGEWSPWSVLADEGAVVGLGWQIFGSPVVYGRDWYDHVPSPQVPSHAAALAAAAPGACAQHRTWAERYGLVSLHVYFGPEPWTLACRP